VLPDKPIGESCRRRPLAVMVAAEHSAGDCKQGERWRGATDRVVAEDDGE
jgi:hypothetical protein